MSIVLHDAARQDLLAGYWFYEEQSAGLGAYVLDSLYSDVDSLLIHHGVHRMVFGAHRSLSKRFPFAIYYETNETTISVLAILDCRRDPAMILRHLHNRPSH